MSILKTAFQLASSTGGPKLSILIFHRVLPETDPLFPDEPDARRFDQMMGWVKTWFNVMPLDAAVNALKKRNLPARAMAITFDDGYADNRTIALPILKRHGLSATFFIATGYLNGGRMWNDTVIESIRKSQAKSLELDCIKSFDDSGLNSLPIRSLFEKRNAIQRIVGRDQISPRNRTRGRKPIDCRSMRCRPSGQSDDDNRADHRDAPRRNVDWSPYHNAPDPRKTWINPMFARKFPVANNFWNPFLKRKSIYSRTPTADPILIFK